MNINISTFTKKRFKLFFFSICFYLCFLGITPIYCESDRKIETVKTSKEEYLWSQTPYLAVAYGFPQGFRAETGYTLFEFLSLGISFGIGDFWSNDPKEGTLAFTGRFNYPIENTPYGAYISILYGGNLKIFGNADTYTIVNLGFLYPLTDFLHLRPELGVAFLSKYISGGWSFFGGSMPVVYDNKKNLAVNLVFELDLRPLLWKSWK